MAQKDEEKEKKENAVKIPKALVKEIAEIAAESAERAFTEKFEKYKIEEKDRRYHNTKLLLRNYRQLQEYNENGIYSTAQLCADGADDILSLMGSDKAMERKVDVIEDGVIKTRIMMQHLNTALKGYKAMCEESYKPEVQRRWRVLEAMYLLPEAVSVDEICSKEHTSTTRVYADIDAACKELSTLFFGLDVLELL